jgi:uncharacterized protein YggE
MWCKSMACSVALAAVIGAMAAAQSPEKMAPRTIQVSAMAEVKVVPDEVVVTVGIHTEDPKDLLVAKSDNDQRTRAVIALADKHGLGKEHVQLTDVSMGPHYTNWHVLDHYYVRRSIEFVVRDFARLDAILSDCVDAGATHVDDLLFRTTKNVERQVEAREKAVGYAKTKAGHLASLTGMRLGKPVSISEDVEMNQHTRGTGGGMGGGMGMGGMGGASSSIERTKPAAQTKIALVADRVERKTPPVKKPSDAAGQVPIPPGVIVLSATVNIEFELLDAH